MNLHQVLPEDLLLVYCQAKWPMYEWERRGPDSVFFGYTTDHRTWMRLSSYDTRVAEAQSWNRMGRPRIDL